MKTFKQLKEQLGITDKVKKVGNKVLDAAQVAGDVVGVFDPTPVTDLVNAGVSAVRGATASDSQEKKSHYVNAALRGVSAVPYAGDAVGKTALAAKMGINAAKAGKAAGATTKVIKGKEAILRKELAATTDSATKMKIQQQIRGLQQAAREEAQQQSKERLSNNRNSNRQEEDMEEEE